MENPRTAILDILIEMAAMLDPDKRRIMSMKSVDSLIQGEAVDLGLGSVTISVWSGNSALTANANGGSLLPYLLILDLDKHREALTAHMVNLIWHVAAARAAYGWVRVKHLES